MTRSLDPIIESLKEAKSKGKGCVLLTGSGCSVSAGIPDAKGMADRIQKEFPKVYAESQQKDFHHLMAKLAPQDQDKLFSEWNSNNKVNWTHIAVAQWLKEGYIDRLLTTNFDSLARKACSLLGEFPAVYDGAASLHKGDGSIRSKSIVHLHGQKPGAVAPHTREGFEALQKLLEPVLKDAGKDVPWIVVGYRGVQDPVFEYLKKVDRFEKGLYWIGLEELPPEHVQKELLGKNNGAVYIGGLDADSFFVTATRSLGTLPPEFVSRPFSYLNQFAQSIAPFPIPGQEDTIDITGALCREMKVAIAQYESSPATDAAKTVALDTSPEHKERVTSVLAAQQHLLKGDADAVLAYRKQYDKTNSVELAELLYWAYVMKGDDLMQQFKTQENGESPSSYLIKAADQYQAASEIKPDISKAFFQLGLVLMELAKWESGDATEKLYSQAGEKFAKTVELDPKNYEAFHWLGVIYFERGLLFKDKKAEPLYSQAVQYFQSALSLREDLPETLFVLGKAMVHQAKWVKGGQAVQLFSRAMEKFQSAIHFQPSHPEAFYSWGHVLMKLAENLDHEEGDSLLAQAQEKFQSAIVIKPDYFEAHSSLGKVLWMRGARWNVENAESFFSQAIEKFQAALSLNKELPEALHGWGSVLFTLGMKNKGEKAFRFMTQAVEKYKSSLAIEANNADALNSWGNALFFMGKNVDDVEAESILGQAAAKYQEVLTLKPNHSEALTNWGNVYLHLSQVKKGQESVFLNQAAEKYRAALDIDSQNAEALSNWGTVLFRLAQRKDFPDTAKLYKAAEEKYQAALVVKPAYPEAYNNLGWILAQKALSGNEKDTETLFNKAGENFAAAIDLNPEMSHAWINWGLALMEQAKTKKGIHVHPFLANAKKKLQKGEALDPGSGSYPLARLMALLANETGCKEWLEKSRQLGSLPHQDIWMNEPDFDNVHESKWFKSMILDHMGPKSRGKKQEEELARKA